jgi:hypothetical protein
MDVDFIKIAEYPMYYSINLINIEINNYFKFDYSTFIIIKIAIIWS